MEGLATLYARNSNGKINRWKIEVKPLDNSNGGASIVITEGDLEGKQTVTTRNVLKGKNIGKMNETSPFEQALSQAESRWNDKKKKGYKSLADLGVMIDDTSDVPTINDFIDKALPMHRTDANNINKPMKAQPYYNDKGLPRIIFPCFGQPKLNGFRVIARWETVKEGDGMFAQDVEKVVFRSKEGLRYTVLEHIEKEFTKGMFTVSRWNNKIHKQEEIEVAYDGEMYCHGMKLQDISSAVKKKNPNTEKLKFHIFDIAVDALTQKDRLEIVGLFAMEPSLYQNIQFVEHHIVESDQQAQVLTDQWISEGYEGGIFRDMKATYQFGSRPKTMVKLKRLEEQEFPIIDVVGGENAPDLGIFVCSTKEGKTFKVNPDASHLERKEYLINKDSFIGKKLQIKFHEWTKDKIPFHIKEAVVRDYE